MTSLVFVALDPPTNKLLLGIGDGSFFDPIPIYSEENFVSMIVTGDVDNGMMCMY